MPFDMFITSRSLQAGSQIVPQHPDHQGDRDSTFEDNFAHRSAGAVEQTRYIPQRPPFPAKARFNIDETRVIPSTRGRYVVGAPGTKDLNKNNSRAGRIKCYGTCVPFISSDGGVFMVSYVLKSKEETQFQEVIPDEPRGRSGCPHFYAVTKLGFLNKKIFKNFLFQFEKEWHLKNPGLDCIVFLDNCSVHRSDDLVSEDINANFVLGLAKKGAWLYFFPPNTTAWLQPLDDVAFGLFKMELGRKHEDGRTEAKIVCMVHLDDPTRIDGEKSMCRARETFGIQKTQGGDLG